MTNKIHPALFYLEDDDTVYLRAFHNPADLWNGWNKPYATFHDLRDYFYSLGWDSIETRDTFIIRFWVGPKDDGYWEYDEFPLVSCETESGTAKLYDLQGWCWLEKSR